MVGRRNRCFCCKAAFGVAAAAVIMQNAKRIISQVATHDVIANSDVAP